MITDFWTWLIGEARHGDIEPAVLQGYERAFRDALLRLIRKTSDPGLHAKLKGMIDCPVRTPRGCRGFAEYIHSALLKNGIQSQYDIEGALQYVVEKMLMDTSETTGQPKSSLFSGFSSRPDETPNFNPLQARFMSFLRGAIYNIRKGKIRRLLDVERRPQGTVSIGQGRQKSGDFADGISPDEVAERPSSDADFAELLADIVTLLRRKEYAIDLPLVKLFNAITLGQNTNQQRAMFGDSATRRGRQEIVATIRDYADKTANHHLLHLMRQIEAGGLNKPAESTKPPKPNLSDKERDYRSIASVIARFDHPVGTAQLGSLRRRWLEYPPRDASSRYKNRLEEVLAMMVQDEVLQAIPTKQNAIVYGRGANFDQYDQDAGA